MVWCGGGDSKDGSGGVECWQKKAMVAMISDNDNVDGGGNNSDDSGVFFFGGEMIVVLIAQRNWSNKGKREKRKTFFFNPINFGLYFFDLKKKLFNIFNHIKHQKKPKK